MASDDLDAFSAQYARAREGNQSEKNPKGCLRVLTAALKGYGCGGDVDGLRAYVRSDAFMASFNGLDAERRQTAMRSFRQAEALCEANQNEKSAKGCLRVLTAALMGYARKGDVDGLRAYARSDAFMASFNSLDPEWRQTATRSFGRAEALCEARAPHPLVRPQPIDARRAQKANWSDPARRAQLAEAYAVAGGDHEKAARILGVPPGSARLAKKRYLDASAQVQLTLSL